MVIAIISGAVIIAISVVLMLGKGSFLIAGYNTMPTEKKAQYDASALCKFLGKVLLPVGVLTVVLAFYHPDWLAWAVSGAIVALVVFAAFYANTGKRFKR
ncbi:MAG: DUF3784 domain-containing protein [Oscillospiraceae bacterium]|jgi:hypothetical protein|nr:DUF3784 domain-containing protein [Oscillospiraceae bacterium]